MNLELLKELAEFMNKEQDKGDLVLSLTTEELNKFIAHKEAEKEATKLVCECGNDKWYILDGGSGYTNSYETVMVYSYKCSKCGSIETISTRTSNTTSYDPITVYK